VAFVGTAKLAGLWAIGNGVGWEIFWKELAPLRELRSFNLTGTCFPRTLPGAARFLGSAGAAFSYFCEKAVPTVSLRMIYLDNNATTRLDPRVPEAMLPFLTDVYVSKSPERNFPGLHRHFLLPHAQAV